MIVIWFLLWCRTFLKPNQNDTTDIDGKICANNNINSVFWTRLLLAISKLLITLMSVHFGMGTKNTKEYIFKMKRQEFLGGSQIENLNSTDFSQFHATLFYSDQFIIYLNVAFCFHVWQTTIFVVILTRVGMFS